MQTLLKDIDLDVQELKCLLQPASVQAGDSVLRPVALRIIRQMRARLDALAGLISSVPADEAGTAVPDAAGKESAGPDTPAMQAAQPASILAERIRVVPDLRRAISLNDSFRFVRELFGGDAERMNHVIEQIGKAGSLGEAQRLFLSLVHPDEESQAAADFMELLKRYFS